jgi:hypothetical protein
MFVQNGVVIDDDIDLAIQGKTPLGLAARGRVIYRGEPLTGPQPFITSVMPAGLDTTNSGLLGARIIVGSAPIKVSALGLWAIPQNTATTLLYLSDPSWNIPAMPAVNMAAATPGQFAYGEFAPITLPAGSTWFIWISGAAAWLDASAVTHTGDASIDAALGMTATVPDHAYGPVNFLYEL